MKPLLIAVTLAFAFSATSAMAAAPIPHNDDDPDHWGAAYTLDVCLGEPCEHSVTSTDSVAEVTPTGEETQIHPCGSQTAFYEFEPNIDLFQAVDHQFDGESICHLSSNWTERSCVYSPSGFTNGTSDIEFWVRSHAGPGGAAFIFAKAPHAPIGSRVYRVDSWEVDNQVARETPEFRTVINGTFEVDGDDPILFVHNGNSNPCGYPELN